MRVSRKISIYRAQRSQQGCSLSLGMLRLAEPPTGRARLRSSLKSPRNPITPIKTSRVATLHPGLYKWLREGARRVIGATAKPLYPIDGKAAGFDRRNPKTSLFEGGGPPAAEEGVRSGGRRSPRSPENSALTLHMLLMPRMLKAYDVFLQKPSGILSENVEIVGIGIDFCLSGLVRLPQNPLVHKDRHHS